MFVNSNRVSFFGNSGWYIMSTVDSYSGQRNTGQAGFLSWFSTNSFGGTNYSNTPVGAVSYVDEPFYPGGQVDPTIYYGYWAAGNNFAFSAWAAAAGTGVWAPAIKLQAIGDPFVRK